VLTTELGTPKQSSLNLAIDCAEIDSPLGKMYETARALKKRLRHTFDPKMHVVIARWNIAKVRLALPFRRVKENEKQEDQVPVDDG